MHTLVIILKKMCNVLIHENTFKMALSRLIYYNLRDAYDIDNSCI